MKTILTHSLKSSLPRPVVGCSLQGSRALAMAVQGGSDAGWRILWSLDGDLGDDVFFKRLADRVGRLPFWTQPVKKSGAMDSFALSIDGMEPGRPARRDEGLRPEDLLRSQLDDKAETLLSVQDGALVYVGDLVEYDVPGKPVPETHLVGGCAVRSRIRKDFRMWRKRGIRNPHVASPIAALANLYVFLSSERETTPSYRIVVSRGEAVATAVIMDGWKLVDGVEHQLFQNQGISPELIDGWVEKSKRPEFWDDREKPQPKPLVLTAKEDPRGVLQTWYPFAAGGSVSMDAATADLVAARTGPACIAFGMALQGGVSSEK